MSLNFANSSYPSDPVFDIGTGCDVVCVGDSVDKIIGFDVHAVDGETGLEGCAFEPADYTGYVPLAVVLDANGAVVATMTVTPAVGDDTGTFRVTLATELVTAALKAVAVKWKLSIEFGGVKTTLVLARFKIS